MSDSVRSYRDLKVWQKALDLVDACYAATRRFPADERFGLTTQVRRAAISIPANIAEGYGRRARKPYLYHLSVARGSLRELETLLLISNRQRFVNAETYGDLAATADEIARMLHGLCVALGPRPEEH